MISCCHITHTLVSFFNLVGCCSKKEEILCFVKPETLSLPFSSHIYVQKIQLIIKSKPLNSSYICDTTCSLSSSSYISTPLLFSEEPQLATRSKAMAPYRKPQPHWSPLSRLPPILSKNTDTLCNSN